MLSAFFIRCQLVAGTVEHFQNQTALCNGIHKVLAGFLTCKHGIQINMGRLGPVAAGNFNGFITKSGISS